MEWGTLESFIFISYFRYWVCWLVFTSWQTLVMLEEESNLRNYLHQMSMEKYLWVSPWLWWVSKDPDNLWALLPLHKWWFLYNKDGSKPGSSIPPQPLFNFLPPDSCLDVPQWWTLSRNICFPLKLHFCQCYVRKLGQQVMMTYTNSNNGR